MFARKSCYWYDQCGVNCDLKCDDYTPINEEFSNELYYKHVLREAAEEYDEYIEEMNS